MHQRREETTKNRGFGASSATLLSDTVNLVLKYRTELY